MQGLAGFPASARQLGFRLSDGQTGVAVIDAMAPSQTSAVVYPEAVYFPYPQSPFWRFTNRSLPPPSSHSEGGRGECVCLAGEMDKAGYGRGSGQGMARGEGAPGFRFRLT